MEVAVHHKDYGAPYAGFWRRALAHIIDSVILLSLLFAIGLVVYMVEPSIKEIRTDPESEFSWIVRMWFIGVFTMMALMYYMLFESSSWQATLGKLVMGIEVTDATGEQIGMLRAAIRSWPMWAVGIFQIVDLITGDSGNASMANLLGAAACIAMLWSEQKQGLHDLFAGTLVVRRGAVFRISQAPA